MWDSESQRWLLATGTNLYGVLVSMLRYGGLKGPVKFILTWGRPRDFPDNQTSSGAHPLWRSDFI